MAIDYKIAKHICSVIRRQVQSCFPDLYIEFIIHKENNREDAFLKQSIEIQEHPAGADMIKHIKNAKSCKILKKNRSCFTSIAHHNKSGFLGFLTSNDYLALCFVNCERFTDEETLRSHAFHMAWHAIELYKDSLDSDNKNKSFQLKDHILTSITTPKQLHYNNMMADIFSVAIQTLQGRGDAIAKLSKQRMNDTVTPTTGFFAEQFPFPMCLDTLDFVFEHNIDQDKNTKKPIKSALDITQKTAKTYGKTAIEQWRCFSLPAQEMAWLGHSPDTILGAAIYTSENAYAQSIADMVAERMGIKPETIATLQDYNPFANNITNENMHKKQCHELITSLLSRVQEKNDAELLFDIAKKQNQYLLEKSVMGWCASALIAAAQTIKNSLHSEITAELLEQAKASFDTEINLVMWDTLTTFSKTKFKQQRNGLVTKISDITKIAASSDEFLSIYQSILFSKNMQSTPEKPNITQFISDNAIKKETVH